MRRVNVAAEGAARYVMCSWFTPVAGEGLCHAHVCVGFTSSSRTGVNIASLEWFLACILLFLLCLIILTVRSRLVRPDGRIVPVITCKLHKCRHIRPNPEIFVYFTNTLSHHSGSISRNSRHFSGSSNSNTVNRWKEWGRFEMWTCLTVAVCVFLA